MFSYNEVATECISRTRFAHPIYFYNKVAMEYSMNIKGVLHSILSKSFK